MVRLGLRVTCANAPVDAKQASLSTSPIANRAGIANGKRHGLDHSGNDPESSRNRSMRGAQAYAQIKDNVLVSRNPARRPAAPGFGSFSLTVGSLVVEALASIAMLVVGGAASAAVILSAWERSVRHLRQLHGRQHPSPSNSLR